MGTGSGSKLRQDVSGKWPLRRTPWTITARVGVSERLRGPGGFKCPFLAERQVSGLAAEPGSCWHPRRRCREMLPERILPDTPRGSSCGRGFSSVPRELAPFRPRLGKNSLQEEENFWNSISRDDFSW